MVLDASVVAKWFIPGEPWEGEALSFGEEIVDGKLETYAPQLLLYEMASVISRTIKRGIMEFDDGVRALTHLKNIGINILNIDWGDLLRFLKYP